MSRSYWDCKCKGWSTWGNLKLSCSAIPCTSVLQLEAFLFTRNVTFCNIRKDTDSGDWCPRRMSGQRIVPLYGGKAKGIKATGTNWNAVGQPGTFCSAGKGDCLTVPNDWAGPICSWWCHQFKAVSRKQLPYVHYNTASSRPLYQTGNRETPRNFVLHWLGLCVCVGAGQQQTGHNNLQRQFRSIHSEADPSLNRGFLLRLARSGGIKH